MKADNPIKGLNFFLRNFLKSHRITRTDRNQKLKKAWVQAVGDGFAQRSRVVDLVGGRLIVAVESSIVKHELDSYMNQVIITKLRELLPERRIEKVDVVIHALGRSPTADLKPGVVDHL